MKAIAYILIVSLAFTGFNRFIGGMENLLPVGEMSCHMDCCALEDDCGVEENNSGQNPDYQCPSGCDCGCCLNLMAIHYQFMSLPGADMQIFHYGQHQDNYYFDFFTPPFQPPRLG